MQDVNVIGIDLAKNLLELVALDGGGKVVWRRRLSRGKLVSFMAGQPCTLVAMEACGGSHHWGRTLRDQGHQVRLLPMHRVKPYRSGGKNDRNDALAIAEAGLRPTIKTVPIKCVDQHDVLSIHRCRDLLIGQRTALINHSRGVMSEYGVVIGQGANRWRRQLPVVLAEADNGLTFSVRETVSQVHRQVLALDEQIERLEQRLRDCVKADPVSRRLMRCPGVGLITATAFSASVGDATVYRHGRELAASLGLVPRQHSSGGHQRLGPITKRGDRYLRRLLVEGAHSYLRWAHRHDTRLARWVLAVQARCGRQKAAVALANKNARVLWKLMASGEAYRTV